MEEYEEGEKSQLYMERLLLGTLYECQDNMFVYEGFQLIGKEDLEFYEEIDVFTKKLEDYLQKKISII
tara:strand:+ start:162 stop:365 length:204 start_codon:yes stop_codon:yes gene_type:complete